MGWDGKKGHCENCDTFTFIANIDFVLDSLSHSCVTTGTDGDREKGAGIPRAVFRGDTLPQSLLTRFCQGNVSGLSAPSLQVEE